MCYCTKFCVRLQRCVALFRVALRYRDNEEVSCKMHFPTVFRVTLERKGVFLAVQNFIGCQFRKLLLETRILLHYDVRGSRYRDVIITTR